MDAQTVANCVTADGGGAFDRVEFDGAQVVLRTKNVKAPDRGQALRLYFDDSRKEVMTGRRFEILPSDLWLLRSGTVYRCYSNVLVSDLPDGATFEVTLTEDAKDAFGILSFHAASDGRVCFTVVAFRAVEMEPMVSIARLSILLAAQSTEVEPSGDAPSEEVPKPRRRKAKKSDFDAGE